MGIEFCDTLGKEIQRMKFNNSYMNNKIDIYKPGFLTSLTEDVLSGKPVKEIRRLTTDEMHRLPEIYAQIDYTPTNLYELDPITKWIEDEKEYKTGNGKTILGADIKAITMLMYLKPRTAYWKPDKAQIYDTSMCGAVPIPLLGFKRWKGIDYSKWFFDPCEEFDHIHVYTNQEDSAPYIDLDTDTDWGDNFIQYVFALDLLLGHTLASTSYNMTTDMVEWNKSWGLVMLSQFKGEKYRPNALDINAYRQYGMGNHPGSYASAYGTAKVELEDGHDITRTHLYNNCSTPMRLMLAQRWAWYGNHRNSDMITDFQNWDNLAGSVDNVNAKLRGMTPSDSPMDNLKRRFDFQ
jgi:hypothetical protein